jgi:hypothetical protein
MSTISAQEKLLSWGKIEFATPAVALGAMKPGALSAKLRACMRDTEAKLNGLLRSNGIQQNEDIPFNGELHLSLSCLDDSLPFNAFIEDVMLMQGRGVKNAASFYFLFCIIALLASTALASHKSFLLNQLMISDVLPKQSSLFPKSLASFSKSTGRSLALFPKSISHSREFVSSKRWVCSVESIHDTEQLPLLRCAGRAGSA